jgi:hypothetical protein
MNNNKYNHINENIISFKNIDMNDNKNQNFSNYSETNYLNEYPFDYKKYSELCEKLIKQLNPNQKFPVTIEDLTKNNCLSSMEIRYQMKETQLMKMENEIKNLRNKCAILEEQNKQMVESREKIFKTLKEQKNSLIFPPPERIPVEKLFEGYSKLYEAFNKISNDKEVAIVSLQNEILINDQQRNYIEILKQTLESNLVKNGIKSQIDLYNKIQKKIKSEDCINNLDSMSDYYEELFNVVGLNQKIEDLYKQNNTLELENNKLKSDINDINSKNEVFREQINNSLKSGIKELDQAKYKIKDLEQQKKELINENKNLQEYIDKIKIQLDNYKGLGFENNNNNEINLEEFMNKFIIVQDECQGLKNNLNQIQNNNELLYKKNQEQKEEIDILRQENESLINEINNLKSEFNKSKQNQFLSFSNNNNEESIPKNSLNSMSMKVNIPTFEGQNNFNVNNTNEEINSNNIFNELKVNIHNCLINSNEFIQYCFSKYKENESMEEEFQKNEIWNNLINSLSNLSKLFQMCYNLLNNMPNEQNNINNFITNKKNKNNSHSSLKKTNDNTPQEDIMQNASFKMTESNDGNNIDIKRNQELLFELEKYKEDNRLIYQNYKKLENENIELFFVNKENKFYYKLITRILQYHINNSDVKNIINKLVLLNGKAISLDIEKNKIKIKIDDIYNLISSSSSNENMLDENSRFFRNNEIVNSEELEKLKMVFSQMEKELNEKYFALKNLDKELKSFEIKEM